MPKARTPDGVEIHYDVRGSGPINLACLHGWGGVGGLWFQVVKHLDPRQFCCWLIDSRGHGRSAIPASGYDWAHFASDVLAVADQEGGGSFIPVGSSLGGKLAFHLTAQNPDRIPAQILVAPVGPLFTPFTLESRLELCRQAAHWEDLKAAIKDWFGPGASEQIIDACARAVSRTPQLVLTTTAETLFATPLPISRVAAPTLLIIGERDPIYGPAYQNEHVAPYLSQGETVTLAGGHFAPIEQPAEVAALITRFAASFV
ncbi:MAG TPA: alpha/beta hydrolase [Verrucomicrobiae bacterium]|jgi:pimeloyl-ACP methyl ester carboxylesterase|nr:alpha/beta hydrolase [Verrucomicrobiae bacterium]